MSEAINSIKKAIQELEDDIRQRPDVRLEALENLKKALDQLVSSNLKAVFFPSHHSGIKRPAAFAGGGNQLPLTHGFTSSRGPLLINSKKLVFRRLVEELLSSSVGNRIHRSIIIAHALSKDMFPGSKDYDRDVSKYLSTDGTFAPDGDGFWRKKTEAELNENRTAGANLQSDPGG